MNKIIGLIGGLFLVWLLTGCEGISKLVRPSSIDVKLIGVWKGEHREEGGTIKRWLQTRNADGTYEIEFSFTESDGATKSFSEAGRWWVQDGIFYEVALPEKEQPDKYRYFFNIRECVSFVLIEKEQSATDSTDSYAFSECLIADSPPATIGRSI